MSKFERAQKARSEAVRLFQLYFKKAFESSGLKWDTKDDARIECAVDLLMNAAVLDALVSVKEDD